MRFQVRGANRDTGADVVTEIEADSEAEATEIANEEGIMVSRVRAMSSGSGGGGVATAVRPMPPPLMAQPAPQPQQVVVVQHAVAQWSPGVAAVLSFVIPGLGQMYKGQVVNGFVWFLFTALGYICFVIPGVILHLCCVIGAASGAPKATPPVVTRIG